MNAGKKFFIDGLRSNVDALGAENQRLRAFALEKLKLTPEQLDHELGKSFGNTEGGRASATAVKPPSNTSSILAAPGDEASAVIDNGDFMLMQALTKAQVGTALHCVALLGLKVSTPCLASHSPTARLCLATSTRSTTLWSRIHRCLTTPLSSRRPGFTT